MMKQIDRALSGKRNPPRTGDLAGGTVVMRGDPALVKQLGGDAAINMTIRSAGCLPSTFAIVVASVAPTTSQATKVISVHVENIRTDRGITYLTDLRGRWLSQLRQDLVRGRFGNL
jgi:hypothetical protein